MRVINNCNRMQWIISNKNSPEPTFYRDICEKLEKTWSYGECYKKKKMKTFVQKYISM